MTLVNKLKNIKISKRGLTFAIFLGIIMVECMTSCVPPYNFKRDFRHEFNRKGHIIYEKIDETKGIKETGYGKNENKIAERIEIYKRIKDVWVLKQINYDFDKDKKPDFIMSFDLKQKGYFLPKYPEQN